MAEAESKTGMMGESFAWVRRTSPLARIAEPLRSRVLITVVTVAAILFPIINGNDADIDSAANALAFAALALGLNIVVGFAGLLDLGYAAFFAIGAYTYGAAASHQLLPAWSDFWLPFQWLGLVAKINQGAGDLVHFQVSFWLMLPISAAVAAFFGVLFGAPTLRLRGDYLAIVTLGFGEILFPAFDPGGQAGNYPLVRHALGSAAHDSAESIRGGRLKVRPILETAFNPGNDGA